MRGFITELDFELVDQVFPGIVRHYEQLVVKPATFLELFWSFTHQSAGCHDCDVDSAEYGGLAFAREPGEGDRRFR